jgi:hypothetical protein
MEIAYVNYPDKDFGTNPNSQAAKDERDLLSNPNFAFGVKYYGPDAFVRLARIKTSYDPDNVFHFDQSVPIIGH